MRNNGESRMIIVNKEDLINKVKENKEKHIIEFEKAVKAYKIEAKRKLTEELQKLKEGSLRIQVSLVSPSNKTEDYDRILASFEWEVNDEVILSQEEFNEYVLDETSFAREAKFANATYFNSL